MALRVAMFPRGIDGLFLRSTPDQGVEMVALVERGTPEESWARSFLPASHCIAFMLPGGLGACPTSEELLTRSNIDRLLAARGISALLLSATCTPKTHAWARANRVRLWMVDYAEQRRLEDKIWFDAFLRRHALPTPPGAALRLDGGAFPFRGGAVVQARRSMGGEGTYFVEDATSGSALVARGILRRREKYLVRKRVAGQAYGITVLVAPGRVALSAIRRQCYFPDADERRTSQRVFAGIQWIPSSALSARLRRRLDRVFLRLGGLLYERRAFGLANLDFMIDEDEGVLVLECNARMSAATPQLLHFPELLSGGGAGTTFASGFLKRRVFSRLPERTPIPDSTYEGATLDLVARDTGTVERAFGNGIYRAGEAPGRFTFATPDVRRLQEPNELCLISLARGRQTCKPDDTLAEILSNAPLYDTDGEMTPHGRRVSSFFRYTDDRQRPRTEEAAGSPSPR